MTQDRPYCAWRPGSARKASSVATVASISSGCAPARTATPIPRVSGIEEMPRHRRPSRREALANLSRTRGRRDRPWLRSPPAWERTCRRPAPQYRDRRRGPARAAPVEQDPPPLLSSWPSTVRTDSRRPAPRIDRLSRLNGRRVDRQIECRRRALRPILHCPERVRRSEHGKEPKPRDVVALSAGAGAWNNNHAHAMKLIRQKTIADEQRGLSEPLGTPPIPFGTTTSSKSSGSHPGRGR